MQDFLFISEGELDGLLIYFYSWNASMQIDILSVSWKVKEIDFLFL